MAKRKETEAARSIDEIAARLIPLLKQLDAERERAKALGLFVEDRELLACPKCGLVEDVAIDGKLLAYHRGHAAIDSRMRFTELSDGLFRCPSCGTEVREEPEQD